MIRVNDNFYERGFSIDGKENRIMLKKNEETLVELTFLGKKVKLKGTIGNCLETVNFSEICEITIDNGNPPLPAVILY